MSKSIVHINRNIIQHNSKHSTDYPVCRVEADGEVVYAAEVHFHGPSKMVYSPENPRPCGAKLWLETEEPLDVVDERGYDWISGMMKMDKKLERLL